MSRQISQEESNKLFQFCHRHFVYHYDVQVELVDHLASSIEGYEDKQTLFNIMQMFADALVANDSNIIQDLLPALDNSINRVISLRTRVGALSNSVDSIEVSLHERKVFNATHQSFIEDADVAELFSDISKYRDILQTSYKVGSNLMNKTLLDFIR